MRSLLFSLAACAAFAVAPAQAQDQDASPTAADLPDAGGDFAIVGAGAAILPDYEGSNDYSVTPFPAAIGRVSGFAFTVLGNRASVDLIRDGVGPTWDFQAGPIAVVNFNRSSVDAIDDIRVASLPERDIAIELGGYVGIGKTGVITSDFDRLSASLSYRTDVSGTHESGIWTPSVSYSTPLSRKALVGLFVSAERVENRYADTYFSVTAPDAVLSGLPAYDADGGWKHYTIGLAFTHSLTGDLLNGLQLVAGGTYKRMLNDFGDSPITSVAGSRGQWLGAVGLAYSF
ncbi:MipA/OmpV family protein [Sphingomonas japonica]|uniref:Outer membrane scaffolding protein for murein synthesis (MipA/OmpV family) n=1 Tax=Sphingomonas japonica TaxID=511662 RepID=A0ABX0U215_9SPHN|nr:MipA/OmpV family protein [Sphingomonas japonica]NIJ23382.1 outer membrane scaffolding protein for murein synthesis (MipA/OmpV family) [Sphingomonas japonica]